MKGLTHVELRWPLGHVEIVSVEAYAALPARVASPLHVEAITRAQAIARLAQRANERTRKRPNTS